jgi:nitrate reductase delta subunit
MKTPLQLIYQRFAQLLSYPSPELYEALADCQQQLTPAYPEAATGINQFQEATAPLSLERLEEIYTSTFDVNPVCFPYPGFHLFGENFNRADFLVKLKQKYEEHGFTAPENELADHLPVMLEFLSIIDPDAVLTRELIEDCLLPALKKMSEGFTADSPYGAVVRSLLNVLQNSHQPAPATVI